MSERKAECWWHIAPDGLHHDATGSPADPLDDLEFTKGDDKVLDSVDRHKCGAVVRVGSASSCWAEEETLGSRSSA